MILRIDSYYITQVTHEKFLLGGGGGFFFRDLNGEALKMTEAYPGRFRSFFAECLVIA